MKIKSQKVQRFFLITALFVSVFLSMIIYFHDYIKTTAYRQIIFRSTGSVEIFRII